MDMSYKNMLNIHALKQLTPSISIPDRTLCIGEAERLDSIPVLIFTELSSPTQKARLEDMTKMPIEKFGLTGDGNYIDAEDFEQDNFFDQINLKGDF